MSHKKDLMETVKEAVRAGWKVAYTGGGHVKLTSPTGAIVFTSGTPSDGRGVKNFRATLKRKGLKL